MGECPKNSDDTRCSGHGTCVVAKSGPACSCNEGFVGLSCEFECPTSYNNGTICSGHGQCSVDDGKAVCACLTGTTGETCNATAISKQEADKIITNSLEEQK